MAKVSELKSEFFDLLRPIETKVFLFLTIILLLLEYYGWQGPFFRNIAPLLRAQGQLGNPKFSAQVFTTSSFTLLFILFPIAFLALTRQLKTLPLGFKIPPLKSWIPYFVISLFMFLVLAVVCKNPQFYKFYPLYRPTSWGDWLAFELVYMPQFLAVEFLFRGPILYLLKEKFSKGAEAMMTLPYALIHIHKPFPEAMGSIIAGLVLCRLSLKTKSILPGVAVHMFVALSADFFGLYYAGLISRF
ncbi:MAG: CPBP family intramembrane metalloprotease [Halobacteriovoraceae bacterium]|nr:CPBP family intramembrane metalloprotease [Halobacteriovoraceae bacterium]